MNTLMALFETIFGFRWPLVRRSTMEWLLRSELKLADNVNTELAARHTLELSRIRKMYQDTIDEINAEFRPIIEKMAKIEIEPSRETFELRVRFDPIYFRQALVQGNSQNFLRYYADMLSHQIERELRTVNLQRFDGLRPR